MRGLDSLVDLDLAFEVERDRRSSIEEA